MSGRRPGAGNYCTILNCPGEKIPTMLFRISGARKGGMWPSSRRLRFPFGRRGASVLGWVLPRVIFMTAPGLDEERAQASRLRYGHEETSKTDHTRSKWVPGLPYVHASVEAHLAVNRAASIRKNARMGWKPDGTVMA